MKLFQTTPTTLLVLCLSCVFTIATSVQGASFDCGKATTKVEHLICDNPEISKLDDELSAAYKVALKNIAQADSIKQEQKRWMKERNACSDADCLRHAYEARLSTLVAQSLENKADKNPLSAGWDYKQEGGRMGTEPYTVGGDDVMCQQVKDYMNQVAPNWTPDKENSCTSAVRLFPGFTEPPWTELEPRRHEELIARLLRYRAEGAREYFGFIKPSPYSRDDAYYRQEAHHFIETGGRLQYWRTHLLDMDADPEDFIDKHLPPGDQPLIQLRFAVDYSIDARFRNLACRLPNWRGAVFLVTEDMSGPDPHIFDGGATGIMSSSSLFIYEGKPILLDDIGFEVNIHKNRDSTFLLPICTLIYPHYKFEQGK